MLKFSSVEAMRDHMLEGNLVSLLEAMLLFGVQSMSAEIGRIRKEGYVVKSRRVPMTKILVRANQFAACKPPAELPHKEILMTEYWIEK